MDRMMPESRTHYDRTAVEPLYNFKAKPSWQTSEWLTRIHTTASGLR